MNGFNKALECIPRCKGYEGTNFVCGEFCERLAGQSTNKKKVTQVPILPTARVEETNVGPILFVHGVQVRHWLGTMHNKDAHDMADTINRMTPPHTGPTEPLPYDLAAGADRLEVVRANAEYWLQGGRKEPDRARATMAIEQAVNAWKNAAYGLARLNAALQDKP